MESAKMRSETGPKRRGWTEAYARELLAQWKSSQLSVPVFAAQKGFHPDRFYRWRRKIEAQATSPVRKPATVVPLVPMQAAAAMTAPDPQGFALELGAGRVLRIPAGFDPATLKTLLRTLAESSC